MATSLTSRLLGSVNVGIYIHPVIKALSLDFFLSLDESRGISNAAGSHTVSPAPDRPPAVAVTLPGLSKEIFAIDSFHIDTA
jgi:ABC-type Fe2+-enterobactin transport system substrate-binding protein